MKWARWTPKEVEILREGYTKGTNIFDIMRMIDRTEGSIYWKVRKLGLNRISLWTDEEEKILRREYAKGTTVADIVKMLSRPITAIQYKVRHLRLKHLRRNDNTEYGNYTKTLMHRLQDDPHCVVCGMKEFLTINHIHHEWKIFDNRSAEWQYWLSKPIEETKENLNVMCMNCNKLYYYDSKGFIIDEYRRRALEKIALAYTRPVECFTCGPKDIRILEVDHMIKDNYKEYKLYSHILNLDLSKVKEHYQILCTNHNLWK